MKSKSKQSIIVKKEAILSGVKSSACEIKDIIGNEHR